MIVLYQKKIETIKQQEDTSQNPIGELVAAGVDSLGNEVYKYRIQLDLDRVTLSKNDVNKVLIAYSADGSPPRKRGRPKTSFSRMAREGVSHAGKKTRGRKKSGNFVTVSEISNRNSLVMMSGDILIERETDYLEDVETTLECDVVERAASAVENYMDEIIDSPPIDGGTGVGDPDLPDFGLGLYDPVVIEEDVVDNDWSLNTRVEEILEGSSLALEIENVIIEDIPNVLAEIESKIGIYLEPGFLEDYQDWVMQDVGQTFPPIEEMVFDFDIYGAYTTHVGATDSYFESYTDVGAGSLVIDLLDIQNIAEVPTYAHARDGLQGAQQLIDDMGYEMSNSEILEIQALENAGEVAAYGKVQDHMASAGAQDAEGLQVSIDLVSAAYQSYGYGASAYRWYS